MRKTIKFVIILIVITTMIMLYSRYVATRGLITKEYAILDNIPDSYDGLKIIHFSDIHYGRIIRDEELKNISKEINLINPDIVVFTGDLIDGDVILENIEIDNLVDFLSSIKAKYGKYAIRGNHDYLVYADKIEELFTKSGFIYLENSYDILYNENNDKIFIGGIDTSFYDKDDLESTFNYQDDNISYKIILTHEPDITDEIIKKDNSVNLVLAGHSHNGQIRLPLIGALTTPNKAKKYYDNYYKIGNTHLYVSSGIGVSKVNFRLFNRPSINFYRINKIKTQD